MTPAGRPPTAGIVLAGGGSSRMGTGKAGLAWEGTTLLGRIVAVLLAAAGEVVVVRAPGQAMPPLPDGVRVADDARDGRGPLEGMRAGLGALRDRDAVAFVCAVDMPFIEADDVRAVLAALPHDADAAVVRAAGRPQPLAAAYRARVEGEVAALLASGERRATALLERIAVRWIEAATLPGGEGALRNVNTPAELAAARQASREKGTTVPAAPSSSSPSQASAVAPAREVTA